MLKFLIKKHPRWLIWGSFGQAINTCTIEGMAVDEENNEKSFFHSLVSDEIKCEKSSQLALDAYPRAEPLSLTSPGWEALSPAGSPSPGCRTPRPPPPPMTGNNNKRESCFLLMGSSAPPLITPALWRAEISSPSCVRVIYPTTNKVLLRSIGL